MDDDSDCPICIETFNKSTRKQITCAYCSASACKSCCQQYLLIDTATEPNCAHCRAAWNADFMVANFTAAFRTGVYKKHREKVLFDREKVRLPETQDDARRYKEARDFVKPFREERIALNAQIYTIPEHAEMKRVGLWRDQVYAEYRKACNLYYVSSRPIDMERPTLPDNYYKALIVARRAFRKASKVFSIRVAEIDNILRETTRIVERFGATYTDDAPIERKVFVRRCPAADCMGFLSTQWKCGMCDAKACKECHECIVDKDTHVCDPTIVANVKALEAEAKPCPKCASMISKIDGCDQMWCTQCKTAFSWKTGRIETHVVHNPHYFQWMREHGRDLPRQPGDVVAVGGCNDDTVLMSFFRKNRSDAEVRRVEELYRFILDIEHSDSARTTRDAVQRYDDNEWRRIYRVKRLVGELDDTEWQIKLHREEKAYNKNRARIQLIDMYVNTAKDIIRGILAEPAVTAAAILEQCHTLREFAELENNKICEAYQCVPVYKLASTATKEKITEKRKVAAAKKTTGAAAAGAGASAP